MRHYLSLVGIMLLFQVTVQAAAPKKVDFSFITTQPLHKSDEKWFVENSVNSFMAVYEKETFFIIQDGLPRLLEPNDIQEKKKLLENIAKAEFAEYVLGNKSGYQALKIKYEKKDIGAILYRIQSDATHTLYLEQLFVHPNFQRQRISAYVISKLLPVLCPSSKRHEVISRHQNGPAFRLYTKLGFKVGDMALVQKYRHNPLFYISFYKVLQK